MRKCLTILALWAFAVALANATEAEHGLLGAYFSDTDFRSLVLTRTDATIDFDWTGAPPDKAIAHDNYAVRWTGYVQPKYSETYTFYTLTDDGCLLTVKDQLLVDDWNAQPATEFSGNIALEAGKKYELKMEYFQATSNATAKLMWSSLHQKKEIIPTSQLYPATLKDKNKNKTKLNVAINPLKFEAVDPAALVRRDSWSQSLSELDAHGIPRSWVILGPRSDKDAQLFNRRKPLEAEITDDWSMVPLCENGQSFNTAAWNRPSEDENYYVDLSDVLQTPKPGLAFARTDIDWPVDGPALIWFDYDGYSRVFLNNKEVQFPGAGQWKNEHSLKDRLCLPVQMQRGNNVLKVKSGFNGNTGWGFFVRFERNDSAYRIQLLKRMLDLYPEDLASWRAHEARIEIARCYESMNDAKGAQTAWQNVLDNCGNDDEAHAMATTGLERVRAGIKADLKEEIAAGDRLWWEKIEKEFRGCLARGSANEADKVLRDYVARFPNSQAAGRALVYRASFRQDFAQSEACKRYYERARRQYPQEDVVAQFAGVGLAWAYSTLPERLVFDTSGEIQNTIKASGRQLQAANAEDTEKAMRAIGEILRTTPLPLICLSDSRFYPHYAGVRDFVRALIQSLDSHAREIYRSTVESTAWERCKRAALRSDPWALEAMATEYQATPAAAQALNQAASLYMDRGMYSQAGSTLKSLMREYYSEQPDASSKSGERRPVLCAKLAYTSWKDGQFETARNYANQLQSTFANSHITISGRDISGAEFAKKIQAGISAADTNTKVQDGGELAKMLSASNGAEKDRCSVQWVNPLFHSGSLSKAQSAFSGDSLTHLQSYPLVEGDRVIVSSLESIQTFDASNGRQLWSHAWKSTGSLFPKQFTGFPISAPSVKDGKIYLRVSEGKQSAIRCFLTDNGMPRWNTALMPEFRRTIWLSDPLISSNQAIAVYLERSDDDTNIHGVAALDCDTGEVRWKQTLVGGNTGVKIAAEYFGSSMQLGAPVIQDGVVYTATGLGTVAALNAFSGEPIWISGYPRMQFNQMNYGNAGTTDNVQLRALRTFSRGANSVLISGDTLVIAPKDAAGLMGFDRHSGSLRWSREMSDARFVIPGKSGTIFAADDTVQAIDAATGKLMWECSLPKSETPLYGRPVMAGGMILLPGLKNLMVVDAQTGQLKSTRGWDEHFKAFGNLLISGERVFGVNTNQIALLGFKNVSGQHFPLAEASALAEEGKWDAAAAKYLEIARAPDTLNLLPVLTGWTQMQINSGKKDAALGEIDGLLAGKPAMLQSNDGGWKISRDVLASALKRRLGQIPPGIAVGPPAAVNGPLAFAWHLEGDEPRMVRDGDGTRGLWVYTEPYLYSLRPTAAALNATGSSAPLEILWQNYIGLDAPNIVVGPVTLALYSAGKLVVVDRFTGEMKWSVNLAHQTSTHKDVNLSQFTSIAISGDMLAAMAMDGLLVFDLASGKELWWNKAGDRHPLNLSFVDGKVVEVSSRNGWHEVVYQSYDARGGKEIKKTNFGQGEWTWSTSSPDGGLCVFRRNVHQLMAVDLHSGDKRWEVNVPNFEFRWENSNLSWEGEYVAYHGEAKDGPDQGWVKYLIDPKDGRVAVRKPRDGIRFGNSYVSLKESGWQQWNVIRSEEQPPNSGNWKDLWSSLTSQEQGEGCRFRHALLSRDNTRLYLFFTRDGVSSHFLLRTYEWASGQLLDEEILPGTPFPPESWNVHYQGICELLPAPAGNTSNNSEATALLLYTGADGLYVLKGSAESRVRTAAHVRDVLNANTNIDSRARAAGRKALAQLDMPVIPALLAPSGAKIDSDFSFDNAQGLPLGSIENYVPQGSAENSAWQGPDDCNAKTYALWNNQGVFIAVDVIDNRFVPPEAGAPLTSGDSVAIVLNSTPSTRLGFDPHDTFVCTAALVDGRVTSTCETMASETPTIRPKSRIIRGADGKSLRYVWAFPWAMLRHEPTMRPGNARELRLGVAVFDNDGDGVKGALEWGGGVADGSHFPGWLGRISLQDISRERLERYSQVITKIPDSPEAAQYLRLILFNKRGPNAIQEMEQVVQDFLKADPESRNSVRAMLLLRNAYKDAGIPDFAARAAALAKASKVPQEIIDNLDSKGKTDGPGSGLEGEYYDNVDFTNLKITRIDPVVDFEWSSHGPDPSMGPDTFSVKWNGMVKPKYTETYNFHTVSDDGVRLWVDGKLLIDNWTNHGPTEDTGTIALTAGTPYQIAMEYFQGNGGACARLLWSSPHQPKELIPKTCLYPPGFQPTRKKNTEIPAAKLQAAYRECADLLPDSADGWALLQKVLGFYPQDDHTHRIQECETYLKAHPDSENALNILQTLEGLYGDPKAAVTPLERCEALMVECKLSQDLRRGFYAPRIPGWTQWMCLGPFQATGDYRGMDQTLPPEKSVDLEWKTKGPLGLDLAWKKIVRKKDDWNPEGATNLWKALLEGINNGKREEIERGPYFAYAYRKLNVPSARRATLFYGVNDMVSIWVNGRKVVNAAAPGNCKDCQSVEVPLKQGDNEILIKAGVSSWQLSYFFRIADQNGKPYPDLVKD